MRKIVYLFVLTTAIVLKTNAQTKNGITTAAPFLLIATDARAGGMGDVGVATSSDAYSLFHNPSKIAFNSNQHSFGFSYVPWLRNLTDDIFVGNFSYVNKTKENAAWAFDFKYFSLGTIDTRQSAKDLPIPIKPNELAVSGAYALKLSETFSMGVGLRYIHSNLKFGGTNSNVEPINSFAVDVSGYYQSTEEDYGDFNGRYRLGFNIANIGPKVSYTPGQEDFIPTNLKLGGGFDFVLDDFNIISTNLEFTKLLVPTPPVREKNDDNGNGTPNEIIEGKDDNVSWISGIFQSFGDAPGGFSEEMKEFTWAFGAEYLYNKAFALRLGYFNESEIKGNRQFFTLGAGFKTNAMNIDLSYLLSSSDVNNPLENSLRFSLSFDLGEIYEEY